MLTTPALEISSENPPEPCTLESLVSSPRGQACGGGAAGAAEQRGRARLHPGASKPRNPLHVYIPSNQRREEVGIKQF